MMFFSKLGLNFSSKLPMISVWTSRVIGSAINMLNVFIEPAPTYVDARGAIRETESTANVITLNLLKP